MVLSGDIEEPEEPVGTGTEEVGASGVRVD